MFVHDYTNFKPIINVREKGLLELSLINSSTLTRLWVNHLIMIQINEMIFDSFCNDPYQIIQVFKTFDQV